MNYGEFHKVSEDSMRKKVASSYDPLLSSEDIREFKRLLRMTPGVSQNIHSARRINEDHAEVRTGGPIAGEVVDFSRTAGEWELQITGTWVS